VAKTLDQIAADLRQEASEHGGVVTLDSATTGIDGLDALEQTELRLADGTTLSLTLTSDVPDPSGGKLAVSGTASFLELTDQQCDVLFVATGEVVRMDLTVSLPGGWAFSSAFPDVKGEPWSLLGPVMSDAGLLFTSADHPPPDAPALQVTAGLNLTGAIALSGPYELVTAILDAQTAAAAALAAPVHDTSDPVEVSGTIASVEVTVGDTDGDGGTGTFTGTDIVLRGLVAGHTLAFGPLTLGPLFVGAFNRYLPPAPDDPADAGGEEDVPALADAGDTLENLQTAFTFGGLSTVFGAPLVFETDLIGGFSSFVVTFSAPEPSSTITSISQLLGLLGDGAKGLIPPDFAPLGSIGLVKATVEAAIPDTYVPSVTSLSATMAMTQPWPVPGIPLTVETLEATLVAMPLAGQTSYSAGVVGRLVFHDDADGKYPFDVEFTFDSTGKWTLGGTFDGTFGLTLGDLNSVFFGGQVQKPPPSNKFLLTARFTNPGIRVASDPKSLAFTTAVEAELDILGTDVFALQGGLLSVDLAYADAGATAAATFSGVVVIASLQFAVSADVSSKGLVFTGNLVTTEPVDIMTLIGRLLPAGTSLPSWAPAHVTVDKLSWTLDTVSGHDEVAGQLTAQWSLPIGAGQPLALTLAAELSSDPGEDEGPRTYAGKVSGALRLGSTFTIAYAFGKGDKVLTGSWTRAPQGEEFDWGAAAKALGLDPVIDALSGLDLPDLGIQSLTLTVDITKQDVTLVGLATHGAAFFEARKDLAGGTGWGFAVGASLDAGWALSQLGIDFELPDGLQFGRMATALSSFSGSEYTFPQGFDVGGVTSIAEGFNFYASLETSSAGADVSKALELAKSSATTVQIWASVGKVQGAWTAQFTASISGDLHIGDSVAIEELYLTLGATSATFYAGLGFLLKVTVDSKQDLYFSGQGKVEPTGFLAGLAMTAQTHDGDHVTGSGWHDALGIEGLTIGGLALLLGIDDEGIPSFGIYGELSYHTFNGMVLAFLDSVNVDPKTNQSALAGSISPTSLADLVDLLAAGAVPAWLDDVLGRFKVEGIALFDVAGVDAAAIAVLDDCGIPDVVRQAFTTNNWPLSDDPSSMPTVAVAVQGKSWFVFDEASVNTYQLVADGGTVHVSLDPQFYIAPNGVTFTKDFTLPPGYRLDGQIEVLGVDVYVYAAVKTGGTIPGIDIDAHMSAIDLGFLKITAGTPPAATGALDGPELSVATYSDPSNPDPTKRSPHFLLSGKLELLGVLSAEAYVSLGAQGFAMNVDFELAGQQVAFAGLFDSDADGNVEFAIAAQVVLGFGSLDISSVSHDGVEIFPGKDWAPGGGISVLVGIDIADKQGDQHFEAELKFDFFGLDVGFTVTLPAAVLTAIEDAVKGVIEAGEWLVDFLTNSLGLPRFVALVLGGVIAFAEQQLGQALKALGADLKIAVHVFKALAKTAEVTFEILKDVFTGDLDGLRQVIDEVFGLNIEQVAIGQHVGPDPLPADADYDTIVAWLADASREAQAGDYAALRSPESSGLMLVGGRFLAILEFGVVFVDPSLYSLKLTIAFLEWTIEITYHKLSDDLGVFVAEIPPPSQWLTQNLGQVSIDLPTVVISVYTNGDFELDAGFPHGGDWSKSFKIQTGPLTGTGGFYFGKLSSRTSNVFGGGVYNPIVEAGLALRLSYEESVNLGLLSGGMSASFTGVVQGAVGFSAPGSLGALAAGGPAAAGSSLDFLSHPAAVALSGRIAIAASIYGKVDFGIVSGSVNLSVSAAVAIEVRTGKDIVLSFSARVSVSVTITIRIIVKIHISFSFHATFNFSMTLPAAGAYAAVEGPAARPLALGHAYVRHRSPHAPRGVTALGDAPPALTLYFAPEPAVVYAGSDPKAGQPSIVAGLAIAYDTSNPDNAFNALVRKLASVSLARHSSSWESTGAVCAADVRALGERLRAKRSLARRYTRFEGSDGEAGSQIDYAWIRTWLSTNFTVSVTAPPEAQGGDAPGGVTFPMLPDLQLFVAGRAGTDPDQPFRDFSADPRPASYATYVQEFLAAVAALGAGTSDPLAAADDEPQSIAAYVVEDYFQFLLQGAAATLGQELADRGADRLTSEDLAGTDFQQLAGSVGLYFRNGLRIPTETGGTDVSALYAMTGQSFAADPDPGASAYRVTLKPGPSGSWLSVDASMPVDTGALATLAGTSVTPPFPGGPPAQADYLQVGDASWTFGTPTEWTSGGQLRSIRGYPPELLQALAAAGTAGVEVALSERGGDAGLAEGGITAAARQSCRLDLRVQRVLAGGSPVAGVYRVVGFDPSQYAALDALAGAVDADPSAFTAALAYPNPSGAGLRSDDVEASAVGFLRTNLTVSAAPPSLAAARAPAPGGVPVATTLADLAGTLALVREYSITNAPGYLLAYPGDLVGDAGDSEGRVTVSLVVEAAAALDPDAGVLLAPFTDLVLAPVGADDPKTVYEAVATSLETYHVAVAPGLLALEASRTNPSGGGGDQAALDVLYNLFGFRIDPTAAFWGSVPSLPTGPTSADNDDPTQPWDYRLFVPVARYSRENPQPQIPPPAEAPHVSPYAGVGEQVSLSFDVLDSFGDVLAPYHVSGATYDVEYFDELVAPGSWPGIAVRYAFDPQVTHALQVRFAAVGATLDALEGAALSSAIGVLQRVADQLGGPAVELALSTTLEAGGDSGPPVHVVEPSTYGAGSETLEQFVAAVLAYLRARAQGGVAAAGALPPDCVLALTVASPITTQEPSEIAVFFRVGRSAHVNASAAARLGSVAAVRVPVAAAVSGAAALGAFADAFAAAFLSYRLATGVAGANGSTLYAVSDELLGITIGPDPGDALYFAPQPLSNTLQSGSVDVAVFDPGGSGGTFSSSYSDVDLDQSGALVFRAIDRFLGPAYAGPAARAGADDVARIAQARERIASGYASHQLAWLFPGQESQASDPQAKLATAIDEFTENIQDSLDSAYAIDAVLQMPVAWTSPTAGEGAGEVALYGTVADAGTTAPGDGAGVATFGSTAVRVPLSRSGGAAPASLLTFPFATRAEGRTDAVRIQVAYTITHVETGDSAAAAGGRPNWYRLVRQASVPVGGAAGDVAVPLVLRQFPTPPTLVSQQAIAAPGQGLAGMLAWSYGYEFQAEFAPQDQVETTVTYLNPQAGAGRLATAQARGAALSLPDALAYFLAGYRQIAALIDTLPQASGTPPADVAAAVAYLADLADAVAGNSTWADAGPARGVTGPASQSTTYRVTVTAASEETAQETVEVCATAGEHVDIRDLTVRPLKADGSPCDHVGAPVYGQGCVSVSYDPDTSGGQWRRYGIAISGLEVTQWQGALSDVVGVRNAVLLGLDTAAGFQYRTAPARFPRPVSPLLANAGTVLDVPTVVGRSQDTLAGFVGGLLEAVFSAAPAGSRYECVVACSFGFTMLGDTATLSPMRLAPDVGLAPAAAVRGDSVGIEEFAQGFAASCLEWLGAETWPDGAFLSLALTMLNADDAVVLELPSMRLPLSAVTDA
jgi:hypothetical protein